MAAVCAGVILETVFGVERDEVGAQDPVGVRAKRKPVERDYTAWLAIRSIADSAMKSGKTTPQEVGSAATYARRYTLAALVGIVIDDDDDGAKASAPAKPKNELEDTKKEISKALKVYKGENREELIGECQIAIETGNFDMKFARDIMEKMLVKA